MLHLFLKVSRLDQGIGKLFSMLPERTKFGTEQFGLDLLQPVEISQNRQSFLWKCLDKTSGNLEMLAKSLAGERPLEGGSRAGGLLHNT